MVASSIANDAHFMQHSKHTIREMPGMRGRVRSKMSVNVTLDKALVEQARKFDVNVSQAAGAGVEAALRQKQREKWLAENKEAIKSANEWMERHGLVLEKARLF
jgi:antitoxin CcdA